MTNYTFGDRPNSYFGGSDLTITRDDGRTVAVNRKEDWWAVNVKSEFVLRHREGAVQTAAANLSDGTLEGLEEQAKNYFWSEIEFVAIKHGFSEVYQEGREGGWAAVAETRNFESDSPVEPTGEEKERVAKWVEFCFDADDLRVTAEGQFDDSILEANQNLQVELSTYADWVGAEVSSLDGDSMIVGWLGIEQGRPTFRKRKGGSGFCFANEVSLLHKRESKLPFSLCPNCGLAVPDDNPGHATGCALGALLTVVEDRGELDFGNGSIEDISADLFWTQFGGPAADWIEHELEDAE